MFKYYHENPPANHWHKDVFLRHSSYTETFEHRGKLNYAMYISAAISKAPPTFVLIRQILQRQNGVLDVSSATIYNNTDLSYFLSFSFVTY